MKTHTCFSLVSQYLVLRDILSLTICCKYLKIEEEELFKFFFQVAKENIDEYWLDLFLSNSQLHPHHMIDVLQSFQNCVLNRVPVSKYSFKTLSIFHSLNFVYYPCPEIAKLCQTTCHKFGLLKTKQGMLIEMQKALNLYGRRKGVYYSRKNVLNSTLGNLEAKCKSMEIALRDMASHINNIKGALAKKDNMEVCWESRCKRMRRTTAEIEKRYFEIKKNKTSITTTTRNLAKSKSLAMTVNKRVKKIKTFMEYQQRLEILFLSSIN